MSRVSLEEAQRLLPEIIALTAPGEEVEIVEGGLVVAKLSPVSHGPAERRPGSARGLIVYMAHDFDAPVDDFEEPGE